MREKDFLSATQWTRNDEAKTWERIATTDIAKDYWNDFVHLGQGCLRFNIKFLAEK